MDQDPLTISFSDFTDILNLDNADGQEFIINIDADQWQDFPRITSKYSPDRIHTGRDPYQSSGITMPPDYLKRIINRFAPNGIQSPDYISLMANAHLYDLISKLAFIKSARKGKVVTAKDLQMLFDMEHIRTIQ